jgi:hypothetical protein
MSSVGDPLLPVQTSAIHDANIDEADPAQIEAAQERRFRWIRLGILSVAGARYCLQCSPTCGLLQISVTCVLRALRAPVLQQSPWLVSRALLRRSGDGSHHPDAAAQLKPCRPRLLLQLDGWETLVSCWASAQSIMPSTITCMWRQHLY